jgi:medium-chain acyl-[acyl-carrier-protein] hydrolase
MFCLPYAGGAAAVYHPWQEALPDWIDVCPVELPGRLTRSRERPLNDLGELLDALLVALRSELDRPFVLFGYSMGALVAFEFARRLQGQGTRPELLMVGAREAPHARKPGNSWARLSDEAFLAELQRHYRPIPAPLLEDREVMDVILKMLRADFSLLGAYAFTAGPLLDCPIVAFGGLHDKGVSKPGLDAWADLSSAPSSAEMIDGDHFFMETRREDLLSRVRAKLDALSS